MKRRLTKLVVGSAAETNQQPANTISHHFQVMRKVWDGDEYLDFGIERFFRLFLITCRLFFPELYLEHIFGKHGIVVQKSWIELYMFLKVLFPFALLYFNMAAQPFCFFLNIYFLTETFIVIFNRIYVGEQFRIQNPKRILLILFLNFMEVVLSFGVLYASGNYLNEPLTHHIDIIYFSLMTSATVGYGDIHPVTTTGKIIAMAQVLSSLTFLVLFFNFFMGSAGKKPRSDSSL